MNIKSNEIASLIKAQIKNYSHKIESSDVGTVVTVGDGSNIVGIDSYFDGYILSETISTISTKIETVEIKEDEIKLENKDSE